MVEMGHGVYLYNGPKLMQMPLFLSGIRQEVFCTSLRPESKFIGSYVFWSLQIHPATLACYFPNSFPLVVGKCQQELSYLRSPSGNSAMAPSKPEGWLFCLWCSFFPRQKQALPSKIILISPSFKQQSHHFHRLSIHTGSIV